MPRGTTPFVQKTWELLSNRELEPIVCWTRNGEAFAILNADSFAATVLPCYFKHSNMCSFVRQLNTYGFKKVTSRDCKEFEFKHKLFHRDHEDLLPHIVRRTSSSKEEESETDAGTRQEELIYQLVETNKQLARRVKELEEHQMDTNREMSEARRELRATRYYTHRLGVSFESWAKVNQYPTRVAQQEAPHVFLSSVPPPPQKCIEWSYLASESPSLCTPQGSVDSAVVPQTTANHLDVFAFDTGMEGLFGGITSFE